MWYVHYVSYRYRYTLRERPPDSIATVRCVNSFYHRLFSGRNGPGRRRAEGDHQAHMAVTSQKDFGLAYTEKRLWVVFNCSFCDFDLSTVLYHEWVFTYIIGLNNGKLTVGKIYAGLLILESWKSTKFGQLESSEPPVIYLSYYIITVSTDKRIKAIKLIIFCEPYANLKLKLYFI